MTDQLTLPSHKITEWREHDLIREDVANLAHRMALKCDFDGAINGDPGAIGAGCLYLAAMLENDKITQPQLKEITGVGVDTIRHRYIQVAEVVDGEEWVDYNLEPIYTEDDTPQPEKGSVVDRLKRALERVIAR